MEFRWQTAAYGVPSLKLSRSLDVYHHPDMREAAAKDHADIIQLVRRLVNSAASENTILGLNLEDKDQLLEILSAAVRSIFAILL